MNRRYLNVSAACLVWAVASPVAADEPPSDGKALSEIIQSLETNGSGVIISAEFDDGLWEIMRCEQDACEELHIDPASGDEQNRKREDAADELPPRDGKRLSAILARLEADGRGPVSEIEFDDGRWEVELTENGEERELKLDPMTGEE